MCHLFFFLQCPHLYICIVCMYICLNCIYLYLYVYCQCLMLTVCTKGLRVTQFQLSVCMWYWYCAVHVAELTIKQTWLDWLDIQQLRTAIEEEWTNIPQATINNLINSMWRRCVALREANGGHTRYWLVFGPHGPPPPPPPPQYSKTAHFRVAFYCGQPKAHQCNNHAV